MRKFFVVILLFAVTVAVGAEGLSRQDRMRYAYFFQGAVKCLNTGDEQGALDLLLHCKEIDPEAAETYFYLSDCYEHLGNDSMRVSMLVKAAELRPDNDVYKEQLVPIYLNNNEIDKATDIIEDIVARTPERTDMLQLLYQIYNYKKDNDKILETLNRLEVQEGQTEQLTMAKVQVYTKMGDDKRAYDDLKSLCDNHPLDLNYRVMLGNWLLGKNRKKEACDAYTSVLNEDPDNENALMSMMDYYRAEKQDSLADRQRDNLLFSPKTQQSTKFLLLKQYVIESEQNSTDSTEVLRYFDRVIAQDDDVEIMDMKVAYMTIKDMPTDSIKVVLTQILDKQPEHAASRFRLLEIANQASDYNEMIRLALPAQQFNPDEWSFSYFLGFAYMMNDQIEECLKALETAAENVDETDNKPLAVEMYSLMGEAYYKLHRKDEAFKAFDNCLRLDPDHIMTLNNYAYYLSEENTDLDRAAAMSIKTVKAEPTNAIYLDTYAWILYMQGRYEEAKIYMDMGIENLDKNGDNTTYYNHLKAIEEKLKTQK